MHGHLELKTTGCSLATSNTPQEVLPLVGVCQQRSTLKYLTDSLNALASVQTTMLTCTDMTLTALPQRVLEQAQTIIFHFLEQERKRQLLDFGKT